MIYHRYEVHKPTEREHHRFFWWQVLSSFFTPVHSLRLSKLPFTASSHWKAPVKLWGTPRLPYPKGTHHLSPCNSIWPSVPSIPEVLSSLCSSYTPYFLPLWPFLTFLARLSNFSCSPDFVLTQGPTIGPFYFTCPYSLTVSYLPAYPSFLSSKTTCPTAY